ncbi:hypothetical protein AVEN_44987-1 [Araneus ventricosus]|uniref:Uncharacterized protein n=1 Tax=Araneus ventricosus TaxID=182803 RepID=A0A4Y2TZ23_ARAVE|nr:hypothetical protein AVEN_44987-1 [Araneus ventricosus]
MGLEVGVPNAFLTLCYNSRLDMEKVILDTKLFHEVLLLYRYMRRKSALARLNAIKLTVVGYLRNLPQAFPSLFCACWHSLLHHGLFCFLFLPLERGMDSLAESIIVFVTNETASSIVLFSTISDVIFANKENFTQFAAAKTYF